MTNPTLKKTGDWQQANILFDVARIGDSQKLVTGSSDFRVYEFSADSDSPSLIPYEGSGHRSYVTSVGQTMEGVVSGSYDGQLIWWDAASRRPIRSVPGHAKWIRMIAVSPDGLWLASVADDMVCRIWDAQGTLQHEYSDHVPTTPHHYPSMLYAVTISPDGRFLATGDKVGRVIVRDLVEQRKVAELDAPILYTWDPRQRRHSIGGIRSLAFSPDGQQLAVGGIGTIGNIDHLGGPHRLEIFDWASGKRVHEIESEEHKGLVEQIEYHPSGRWFLAAGGDNNGFVTLYDSESGEPLQQEKAPMHVHAFVFNEDYTSLTAVGHNRIARWALG